ncbi:MAG: alginate export family protein [Woeseiaceae bacterium]|nr:alginate export family protein [Woeseiaceae bacterium]
MLLGCLGVGTAPAQDTTPGDLAGAISGGDPGLAFRYRYEFVDDDSFGRDAHASTLRLRLNYETGRWENWSGFVEFDYVGEVLIKDFNSGAGTSGPNRSRYPVVADPAGPDLNQLYLQYAPAEDWRFRFGRQRILLDDQRFVGGVGWRQNEQTYDGLSFTYGGFDRTTVFYSYVANVARIFGTEVDAGSQEQDTHLLNVDVELTRDWHAIGYVYRIDNDDAPAFSTSTFGLRVEGSVSLPSGALDLVADYARQSDAGNSPANFDTDYRRLRLVWRRDALSLGAGVEVLGSDNGEGFRTPLATLHAFNGWADRFLATPSAGLVDVYLQGGFEAADWQFRLRYHDFEADAGSSDFGQEFDLSASRQFADRYQLLLKLAAFDGDTLDDVIKAWVMISAAF